VAFEMAAQMRREGGDVAGVVILDSPAPPLAAARSGAQLPMLAWFAEDLGLGPRAVALAAGVAARRAPEPDHEQDVAVISHPLEALQALADELAIHGLALPAPVRELAGVYPVFQAMVRATAVYRPPVTDVPLLVLRAGQGSVSEFAGHPHAADDDWGWQRHACLPLLARRIDATHHTLLQPPAAGRCAQLIEHWINGSEGQIP
jgi:pyochelin synthetase